MSGNNQKNCNLTWCSTFRSSTSLVFSSNFRFLHFLGISLMYCFKIWNWRCGNQWFSWWRWFLRTLNAQNSFQTSCRCAPEYSMNQMHTKLLFNLISFSLLSLILFLRSISSVSGSKEFSKIDLSNSVALKVLDAIKTILSCSSRCSRIFFAFSRAFFSSLSANENGFKIFCNSSEINNVKEKYKNFL